MIYLFHLHSLLCLLGCSAHSVSDFCSPSILAFFYNPPSCISLSPSLLHPSRWSQSIELISLCYAAASH